MSKGFTIEFTGTYIHIIHAPDYVISPESLDMLWKKLAEACEEHGCLRAFAEGPAPKRDMKAMDAFESGVQAAVAISGLMLACCLEGYEGDKTTDLFKDVAYNRGAHVEFFSDKKEALEWLGVN